MKTSHRREFLLKLGVSAAALAGTARFLPILNASGQEAKTAPLRLILLTGTDGIVSDWNGLQSPLLSRLSPEDIVSVRGIHHNYGGGGEGHMQGAAGQWTASRVSQSNLFKDPTGPSTGGWAEGTSIDQIIAQGIPSYGQTPFRSIALGVGSGEPHSRSRGIYSAPGQPIHPETNALAAYERLFGNAVPSGGVTPPLQDAWTNGRLASIDLLRAQVSRLAPRIAKEERYKLEAHQQHLSTIHERLSTPAATLTCTLPSQANFRDTSGAASSTELVQAAVGLMTDLIVAAFACDVTRIASLQMLHTLYEGSLFGHGQVHGATHGGQTGNIDQFYIDTLGALIKKLKAVPEGNGTMFDNTLIVHSRDLGDGNHSKENIPYILSGGAGGALKRGRALNVDAQQAAMLVSIGRLMGLSTLNSVGNIRPDTGPIDALLA